LIAFLGCWLASDPKEKKRLLKLSRKREIVMKVGKIWNTGNTLGPAIGVALVDAGEADTSAIAVNVNSINWKFWAALHRELDAYLPLVGSPLVWFS